MESPREAFHAECASKNVIFEIKFRQPISVFSVFLFSQGVLDTSLILQVPDHSIEIDIIFVEFGVQKDHRGTLFFYTCDTVM